MHRLQHCRLVPIHLKILLTGTYRLCSVHIRRHLSCQSSHKCRFVRNGPWPVQKRFSTDHVWWWRSKPGCRMVWSVTIVWLNAEADNGQCTKLDKRNWADLETTTDVNFTSRQKQRETFWLCAVRWVHLGRYIPRWSDRICRSWFLSELSQRHGPRLQAAAVVYKLERA